MSPIDAQRDLEIQVDWFKPSGKWYAGGIVKIGIARFHRQEEFKKAILQNQQELTRGWENWDGWTVVTQDLPRYDLDPDYQLFNKALYPTSAFRNL